MLTMYAVGNVDDGTEEEDLVANEDLAKAFVILRSNEYLEPDDVPFTAENAVWMPHPPSLHGDAWVGCLFLDTDYQWYYRPVEVFETMDEVKEAFHLATAD